MVKKLTVQLEKRKKGKISTKVVTVKTIKKPKQKKSIVTKVRERELTELEKARMMESINISESYSSKLKAPKLSKAELQKDRKKPTHTIRHKELSEIEKASMMEGLNFEDGGGSKMKDDHLKSKTSKKEKSSPSPRVRKSRVSEGEKADMIGSINFSESYSKKLKAPKLTRKEAKVEKKRKSPHIVSHKDISDVEKAQMIEELSFEEKVKLPQFKHKTSRKSRQKSKQASAARTKAAQFRGKSIEVSESPKKVKGRIRLIEEINLSEEGATLALRKDKKAVKAKDLSHKKGKKVTKEGKKTAAQPIKRAKSEEAYLHKLEEQKRAASAKKASKTAPKKKQKIREVDLSTQSQTKTISKRKQTKYNNLETRTHNLVGELDDQKEFKGGYLKQVDEQLKVLQQKAIKIELKVNQFFLRKQEVKLKRSSTPAPEKLTKSVVEDVIFEQLLPTEGEASEVRKQELQKLNFYSTAARPSRFRNMFDAWLKKNARGERSEIYLPPEIVDFSESAAKVKSTGIYLPNKLLSRAEHAPEVIENRFFDPKEGKIRNLFAKNHFQSFRKNELKKQKETAADWEQHKKWVTYTEIPFFMKKMKGESLSLKVIPTPLVKFAIKNKKIIQKFYDRSRYRQFPWTQVELKPFRTKFQQVSPISPTFIDQESSVLYEKPEIPPYWKTIREKAPASPSSLYKEFLENFGEYDLLNYSKDSWKMVQTLKDRYFENHLSDEELLLQANQEIAPELNRMMKLLNEQPFLVFPLGASSALYSILPELDGISETLSRHNITPEKTKRVSAKDVHIRSPKGIPINILSNTENALSFSSDECVDIESREFMKLKKFRDFEVEEYSRTFYSSFSESMLLNCSRIAQIRELQKFKKWLPTWSFFNDLFLLDNEGLNLEGNLPSFERMVLREDYQRSRFSHSWMYWDREVKKTAPLDASIRQVYNKHLVALQQGWLKLKLS
ncbi:hypothetical protein [Candidatus Mycoplasma haematominutum]|uniref:Uncharacterized protein n=1 Tax=Candidatus Mycoplasma haematominutum 'Birmingham 1' TaxID=1116213 RepID=G8C2L2_9MOLU|nr:hypothetical protein [Candidatus Mycoplasma haematominutum]CCE66560.1 hypothetical protein (homolog to MSU_0075) [Candidatus Mycoplasma haematominutum 'Birmingham 1']